MIRLDTHLPNSSLDLAAFSSSDFICLKQKKAETEFKRANDEKSVIVVPFFSCIHVATMFDYNTSVAVFFIELQVEAGSDVSEVMMTLSPIEFSPHSSFCIFLLRFCSEKK